LDVNFYSNIFDGVGKYENVHYSAHETQYDVVGSTDDDDETTFKIYVMPPPPPLIPKKRMSYLKQFISFFYYSNMICQIEHYCYICVCSMLFFKGIGERVFFVFVLRTRNIVK